MWWSVALYIVCFLFAAFGGAHSLAAISQGKLRRGWRSQFRYNNPKSCSLDGLQSNPGIPPGDRTQIRKRVRWKSADAHVSRSISSKQANQRQRWPSLDRKRWRILQRMQQAAETLRGTAHSQAAASSSAPRSPQTSPVDGG